MEGCDLSDASKGYGSLEMAATFKMVDGDLFFDVNGRLEPIEGFAKVSQDIAEILLTVFDVDRDFGSELALTQADPAFNIGEAQVSSYVLDAVERLRNLQRTNPTTTAEEEIASIDAIQVFKNDQTEVTFGLAVSTTAGPQIQSSVDLRTPVSLNHLLPPSKTEQSQEFDARVRGEGTVISGEVNTNGS